MDNLDLSVFFHTKAQSNDFLVRLSNLSEEIYKTGFNLEQALSKNFGMSQKDKFMVILRDNNVNTASPNDIKSFLEKLQEKITNLPTLSLTLAFEPNEETLNLLNEWFMLNIKRQFIFDISVNPNLIAGVSINFNGKYMDFSVRERFMKILKESLASNEAKSQTENKKTAQTAEQ